MFDKVESSDTTLNIISDVCDALSSLSIPPAGIEQLKTLSKEQFCMVSLNALGIDESLGAMEFCIQLEIARGIVITPEDLVVVRSASELLVLIESRLHFAHPRG